MARRPRRANVSKSTGRLVIADKRSVIDGSEKSALIACAMKLVAKLLAILLGLTITGKSVSVWTGLLKGGRERVETAVIWKGPDCAARSRETAEGTAVPVNSCKSSARLKN